MHLRQAIALGTFGLTVGVFSGNADAAGAREVVDIDTGFGHSCLLTTCGDMECWGFEARYGEDADHFTGLADIAVGSDHTCALASYAGAGLPFCWGSNEYGQLDAPILLFTEIVSRFEHTCGIKAADGRAECWGWNGWGQVSRIPASDPQFQHLSTNIYQTCGVTLGGDDLYCWGYHPLELHIRAKDVLLDYKFGERWAEVESGFFHNCARSTDDRLYCWGDNTFGAVVNAAVDPQMITTIPIKNAFDDDVDVYAYSDAIYLGVSAGHNGTCTLLEGPNVNSDNRIRCFGWPYDHSAFYDPPPSGDAVGFSPDGISAGSHHACAWDTDTGKAVCWGDNYGTSTPNDAIVDIPIVDGTCSSDT